MSAKLLRPCSTRIFSSLWAYSSVSKENANEIEFFLDEMYFFWYEKELKSLAMQSKSGKLFVTSKFLLFIWIIHFGRLHIHASPVFLFLRNFNSYSWFRNSYMIGEKCGGYNSRAENQIVPVTYLFFFTPQIFFLAKIQKKLKNIWSTLVSSLQNGLITSYVMLCCLISRLQLILTEEERARTHSNLEFQKVLPCRCCRQSLQWVPYTFKRAKSFFDDSYCIKKWSGTLQKPKQSFTQNPWT